MKDKVHCEMCIVGHPPRGLGGCHLSVALIP